ncbi:hypothetical protein B0T10DRAFT_608183 [Thelonectria olida]|uniref:Uncharacterized protein n=1 Tax=Thelonectria olida TaxID=1576542 RepID=A0A9P8W291_9HYPO|nr:hypothetical protein B0T10DRAFT_608183 [Thelonectria olida]
MSRGRKSANSSAALRKWMAEADKPSALSNTHFLIHPPNMAKYNEKTSIHELVSDYAPKIKGKTILTTGVTPNSLGHVFVEAIAAASPRLLILAGRSAAKLEQTTQSIVAAHPGTQTRSLVVDLSSLASVRRAAEEVNSWADVPNIDVVVNNAGVMGVDFALTRDGFETQFAASHVGHFLLTNSIMEKILASDSPRIVNVSSDGHRLGPLRWADPHFSNGETYHKWVAYGQAKTSNMLFAISLAEKLGKLGLQAYSLHPGVIMSTGLGNHLNQSEEGDFKLLRETDRLQGNSEGWADFDVVPSDVGTATHAFAAFDDTISERNGAYLLKCRVADPYVDTVKPWATSPIEADKLWKLSEELVGQKFGY